MPTELGLRCVKTCIRGGVEVAEPRSALLRLAIDEVERRPEEFLVNGLHALPGERTGVLDRLLADLAELVVDGGIVLVGRLALQHAAWSELLAELRVLRIVRVFRLFLGVEVIEVAEELVEAVHGRKMLVAVTEMVLAKLTGGIAEILHELRDRRVLGAEPQGRPGIPTLVRPVRIGDCPVMKAARPAVQLCWP